MKLFAKSAAIHEAGHAVVAMELRTPVDRVEVHKRRGEKRSPGKASGKVCRPGGATDWQELVILYAGPIAQARYQHASLDIILQYDGSDDWTKIEAVIAQLPLHEKTRAERDAEPEARALVKLHWLEILKLADALLQQGTVVF